MAAPTDFEGTNFLWKGWPADPETGRPEVGDLPVREDRDQRTSVSCWKLSESELAEVARSGVVWLQVVGQHPPVYVAGHKLEVVNVDQIHPLTAG